MKVLVVGSGGREHALAWRLRQGDSVDEVFVAPGNPGTAAEPQTRNVDIAVSDFEALVGFARREHIDLTVIGPEVPLVDGVRDAFEQAGLACFGPSKAAAQLEGSKSFTKDFLRKYAIPTARYETFEAVEPALAYLRERGAPIVIKADGLAAGKGVVVARELATAKDAVRDMLSGNAFGAAGARVVIEDFLEGEEASFICICDGERAIPFATSQDHKARDDGDRGPNTGGMGAYSPAPVITAEVHERVMRKIIEPTLAGMAAEGHLYEGFLYAGLMIDASGEPSVIEFNCRFGDPEAQPVMMRLQSDLAAVCLQALGDGLDGVTLDFSPETALGVVMAAGGYPLAYAKGEVIGGLAEADAEAKVFHAGTAQKNGDVVTAGGRVLCVVGTGASVSAAQARAYAGVACINWRDAYWRRDIGYRAIARE
ncbi:MAG: phosphoribosylamine--glycine ligase [Pseudomonadota bacterium]